MSKKILSGFVLGLALLSAFLPAQANPITYHLSDVKFDDGASATGSFTYDATTHSGSSFSVSTTAGILSAFTFDNSNSIFFDGFGFGPNSFLLYAMSGHRYFNFSFVNALTNAGGEFALNLGSSYECLNCSPSRTVSSGSVTSLDANAVPEPGTSVLMLSGFGALGFMLRRRKQAAA